MKKSILQLIILSIFSITWIISANSADIFFQKGIEFYEAKQYDSAAFNFERCIEHTTSNSDVSVSDSSDRLVDAAHHWVIILDVVDVLNVAQPFGQERERETLVFASAQVSNHWGQNVRLRQESIRQRVLVGHTFTVEGILIQAQLFEVISHNYLG